MWQPRVGDHAPLAQAINQLPPSPMHPGLDGSYGDVHGIRDLGVTQLLFMKQSKGPPIFVAQLRQSQSHLFGELLVWPLIGTGIDKQFGRGLGDWTSFASGQRRTATIAGNRQEPRLECPPRVPTMQVPQ